MSLATLFTKATQLPNIPKVVQDLIVTFDNPDVDFEAISSKISLDPVLSARVLRMANSAHYGVPRTIETISDGVVLLGFPALRTLVMASGIAGSMTIPESLDRKQFWRRNFTVAEIAKRLARYCKDADTESTFTAGMIHAVGELLIHIGEPDKAKHVQHAIEMGGNLRDTEDSILGYNYSDVSTELAKRWKFPETVVKGLRYQCQPEKAEEFSTVAGLIRLAKYLYQAQIDGVSEQDIKRQFPIELAVMCQMDTHTVLQNLSAISSLQTGFESIIDGV